MISARYIMLANGDLLGFFVACGTTWIRESHARKLGGFGTKYNETRALAAKMMVRNKPPTDHGRQSPSGWIDARNVRAWLAGLKRPQTMLVAQNRRYLSDALDALDCLPVLERGSCSCAMGGWADLTLPPWGCPFARCRFEEDETPCE